VAKIRADGTGFVSVGYIGGDGDEGVGLVSGDAFVAKVEGSCASIAGPIQRLLASKESSTPDNIALEWLPDVAASGYNIWYVTRKEDVPLARQTSSPPAIAVSGCAVPAPAAGLSCTDIGAVSRSPSLPFFYQARAYCDATTEGP